MTKPRKVPDADLSSAGDDFHILWAIKKALGLLNFSDEGLKALEIEGFDQSLSKKIDPYGNKLLGIDLIEYYGGENFRDAKRVVISQLKYSTLRKDENWTFAKLYQGKKSRSYQGSIIHRLASIYKTLITEFGRYAVLDKVEIKFVSNRNVNGQHLKTLVTFQEGLREPSQKKVSFHTAGKTLSKYQSAFEKLFKASELKPSEFTDFIRLLNFDDCGVDSRDALERDLIISISNTSISSRHQFNSFSRLVWNKMMPESKTINKITVIDIIAELGFNNGSLENLFPVPQRFERLEKTIKRTQLHSIIDEIEKVKNRPICIHGGAGMGKSTIVQQLARHIPDYCECITYDCFGNGSYLDPTDRRHLHRNALVQIANEVAKRIGTDFLITHSESDETYLKEFKRRIHDALAILKERNQNAYLVIIIDAADNNITAASKRGEDSFVFDLMEEPFQEDCKILFTCRSHRKDTLKLPQDYWDIALNPFTLDETEKHLNYYFPDSGMEEIAEFHELTHGIPRVQSYAISLRQEGIFEVINYLRPNGKSVEAIIEERIAQAVKKIGPEGNRLITQFFVYLISLPRPIPTTYLANLLNEKEALVVDLASDLWHGLILHNRQLSFRDEDFENYIRSSYATEKEDFLTIAQLFLNKADSDEYASVNVGNILYEAELGEELKNMVLQEKYRSHPVDPVRNREVYIERTKLAMKIANKQTDNLTFFKLLFIAAEQSKTDKALTDLLIENPNLVLQFGDVASLAKLSANSEKQTWGGSFHLKLAGLYSRMVGKMELSKYHLQNAHQWLNWRRDSVGEDERSDYPIRFLDIALETESVLRLKGPDKAYQSLCRWTPRQVRLSSGSLLLDNVLSFSEPSEIKNWLKDLKLPVNAQIIIISKLFTYEIAVTDFDHGRIESYLKKVLPKKIAFTKVYHLSVVKYCEIAFLKKILPKAAVLNILNFIGFQIPTRVPHFAVTHAQDEDVIAELEIGLKIETLKSALKGRAKPLEELYSAKFREIDKIEDRERRDSVKREKDDFDRFFRHALNLHQVFADRISGRLSHKKCDENFKLLCENIEKDWELRHYSHWASDQLNYLAKSAIDYVLLTKDNETLIELICKSFINGEINHIRLRLNILKKLATISSFHLLSLRLLDEADTLIEASAMSASEVTKLFVECSKIAFKIDVSVGEYYFKKAVKAVSEIDYEAFYQIRCLYGMTKKGLPESNPKLAFKFASYIEYADLKLGSYDKKHFPYTEGIQGIFNMDQGTAFSTLSQWHHRNVVDVEKYIIPLLSVALKNNLINEKLACSLLPLNSYHYYDETLQIYMTAISRFTNEKDDTGLNYLIKTVFRDAKLKGNLAMIEGVFEEIQSNPLMDGYVLENMKEYIDFRRKITPKKTYDRSSEIQSNVVELPRDIKKIDVLSSLDIEQYLREIIKDKEDYNTRIKIPYCLAQLKKECTPQNFVGHLEALVNVSPEVLGFSELKIALEQCLTDWSIHPAVRKWKSERFQYVVLKWFDEFNKDHYFSFYQIESVAELFGIDNQRLSQTLKVILPKKIEYLNDESIYGCVLHLDAFLDQDDNYKLIQWVLKRWSKVIEGAVPVNITDTGFDVTYTGDTVVAGLLRFILGHPDKRLRWRAIHAIRRLVNHGEIKVLDLLLEAQNHQQCHPFQHQDFMYYWMSAKLYLWIALDRLSLENPKTLLPYKDEFYRELFDGTAPHTLIAYFIKKTCIQLYRFDTSIYSASERDQINAALTSALPKIDKQDIDTFNHRNKTPARKKRSFNFDFMDTVPYWYNRLGDFFHVSEGEVADLADDIITNDWGYRGKINEDDYIRGQIGDRDYYLLSKRQGNIPTVESLKTYFEYHAMFCVATKLLNEHPLVESDWVYKNWESWLPERANVWKDYWLSDTRDSLPLEEKYWRIEYDVFDELWRDKVPLEKFDEEIGFGHFFGKNVIAVFAGSTRHFGDNSESVSIRSALVSNKGSDALLRALQSAKDNYDYRIPLEDEADRFQIDEMGFELCGWLNNPRSEITGLDKHDSLSKDIGKGHIEFGKIVEDCFPITYNAYFKKAYSDGKLVSEYRHWDETTEYRHRSQIESNAAIFRVNVGFILAILKKINKSLLIECEINRQLKEKIYGRERFNGDITNKVRIYLIKPDGYVKTLGREDFKIGSNAN